MTNRYSAELYADDGQQSDPPTTLVKVRFQPPVHITPYMESINGFTSLKIDHVGTTERASVYNLWVSDAGSGITHQERISRAAEFVADILADVNEIDELENDAWAENLQHVELNREGQ